VDAGHADTVGYVDDARQLLELSEELGSDGCARVSIVDKRNLGGRKCGGDAGENRGDDERQSQAEAHPGGGRCEF